MLSYSIVIPTFNGGERLKLLLESIKWQTCQTNAILVIDSGSKDNTQIYVKHLGFQRLSIKNENFNHGGTRQLGLEFFRWSEIIIFLTQDAILDDSNSLTHIIGCFDEPQVGAAYGRQFPHQNARPIEAHARLFNYPERSLIKSVEDIPQLGLKTAFISNSFAAYRRSALMEVGGFPKDVIFGEDTYVAAKMILSNWKIAYCAEAAVYHSHHYRYIEEFRRYFDIGVFHAREKWIRQNFGEAEGEGTRFVFAEIKYLWENCFWLIPSAIIRSFLKLFAYKLGNHEKKIPKNIKIFLSMNRRFWK